jgi:hypothetical protein
MFMTMDDFKVPGDAGAGQTLWSAFNLVAVSAVLIVTIRRYGHDYDSSLLLASDQQLLGLIRSPVGGKVKAVNLLFPPRWSPTLDWHAAKVVKIEALEASKDEPLELAVLTLADGSRHLGFPLHRQETITGKLTTLATFT